MALTNEITIWKARILVHLHFLQRVNANPKYFEEESLKALVPVYRALLPLVAEHGASKIWIPEAVMWVFHCHVLHPVEYMRDCSANFGHLVLFNPAAETVSDKEFTLKAFREAYGFDLEAVVADPASFKLASEEKLLKTNTDLIAACKRQKSFTAECMTLLNTDMDKALSDYEKFIVCIKKEIEKNPGQPLPLVPTREIDLVWHTHMRYPSEYLNYVKKTTGYLLNHEDNVPDLKTQFQQTAEIWKANFGEAYEMIAKKADCCCDSHIAEEEMIMPVESEVLQVREDEVKFLQSQVKVSV